MVLLVLYRLLSNGFGKNLTSSQDSFSDDDLDYILNALLES